MKKPKEKKPITISPETHERLKSIGFQKGTSGNPKGRPPIPEDVKHAMATYSLEAVETLVNVMRSSQNDAAKVKAATHILSPFISKAPQQIDVDVNVNSLDEFLVTTSQRRRSIPAAAATGTAMQIIDITPERVD